MESFVRGFIKSSLVWLGIGVLLGVAMALWPAHAFAYRPIHMHANLLGFVSMMIFGVAYHVMPRFAGRQLHSRTLAGVHLWLANLGLAAMVLGWSVLAGARAVLGAGGLLAGAGAFLFIYNIWRTVGDGRPEPVRLQARPPSPGVAARTNP